MKKVFLIGDSIKEGYDTSVRGMLSSVAETYFPDDNARFAAYLLRFLHEWPKMFGVNGEDVDVVHWNTGLWDCLIILDDGPQTPLPIYKEYIERICRRMKIVFPNARYIFATSTPTNTEAWKNPHYWIRRNEDIRAYNEAATEIVRRHGMEVNDLYALMENVPKDWFSDQSHYYTMPGTVALTRQVAAAICDALGCAVPEMTDAEILKNAPPDVKVYGI